jgi:hypothetical protein
MQYWIVTGLAVIFFINAFWLLFSGSYAESTTRQGRFKTYEFEKNPLGYSLAVGLIMVLGCACLELSNPHIFAVLAGKVPQLKVLYTVAKMKNGLFYLIGGGFLCLSLLAFLIRRTITVSTSLTKGHDLDMDARSVRAYEEKEKKKAPGWQKEGDRKSQFDDGTPL